MNPNAVKLIALGGVAGIGLWAVWEAISLLTKSENGQSDIKDTPAVAIMPPPEPAPAPVEAPPEKEKTP